MVHKPTKDARTYQGPIHFGYKLLCPEELNSIREPEKAKTYLLLTGKAKEIRADSFAKGLMEAAGVYEPSSPKMKPDETFTNLFAEKDVLDWNPPASGECESNIVQLHQNVLCCLLG